MKIDGEELLKRGFPHYVLEESTIINHVKPFTYPAVIWETAVHMPINRSNGRDNIWYIRWECGQNTRHKVMQFRKSLTDGIFHYI